MDFSYKYTISASQKYSTMYIHGDFTSTITMQNSLHLDYLLEDTQSVACSVER